MTSMLGRFLLLPLVWPVLTLVQGFKRPNKTATSRPILALMPLLYVHVQNPTGEAISFILLVVYQHHLSFPIELNLVAQAEEIETFIKWIQRLGCQKNVKMWAHGVWHWCKVLQKLSLKNVQKFSKGVVFMHFYCPPSKGGWLWGLSVHVSVSVSEISHQPLNEFW